MGVARVAVDGLLLADDYRNVFTIFNAGATVPASAAVSSWITAMYTTSGLLGVLSNALQLRRFILEHVDSNGKWIYDYETSLSIGGGVGTTPIPNQNAAVVIGVTASRRRGKKFIGGLISTQVVNGVIQSALNTPLVAFGSAWIAGFTDGGVQWLSGVCRSDGSNFLQFTSARVDTYSGTQTRRKPGRGA